ncbi:hypothetical protein HG530_011768 [Fusarium avenaceum]|nr:hypothetical protein HG530_011768 [Fusarium avenaceum]
MGHSIKTTERVQRVDQTSDEGDAVVLPASRVDPSPEHKFGIAVCWGAGNHSDQHNQPADLQVEERKLVQGGNDLVAKHDNASGKQVQALVDNKGLPCLDLQIGLVQGN